MEFRTLREEEISLSLFDKFIRRQVVTDCWRRENGAWVIKPDPFIDDWSEQDYRFLVECLQNTVRTGGWVLGGFDESNALKGFASVESTPMGSRGQYLDLSCIHVSEDARKEGIGRQLLTRAAAWAAGRGAQKLYISAHSAAESQAFYRSLGCVDAEEVNEEHVKKEPYDCQLELLTAPFSEASFEGDSAQK